MNNVCTNSPPYTGLLKYICLDNNVVYENNVDVMMSSLCKMGGVLGNKFGGGEKTWVCIIDVC